MKLALSGGGTGGHIYPALAVAEEMAARGWEIVYLGTESGLESSVVPAAGIRFRSFTARALHRGRVLALPLALLAALRGWCEARALLAGEKPQALFATGGFVSVPAALAAWSRGIPIVIHESNAVPGLANRLLAVFARRVLVCWDEPDAKRVNVGMPFRRGFGLAGREEARRRLGLAPSDRLLLVFGGSRGARSLNQALLAMAERLAGITVFWATGRDEFTAVRRHWPGEVPGGIRLMPYIENMPEVMPAADLAVTRAGAMTLAELAAAGVPAVLVPYPHAAAGHQLANARRYAAAGAGVVVEDHELMERLPAEIDRLLADGSARAAMAAAAGKLARPHAAREIATIIEEVVGR